MIGPRDRTTVYHRLGVDAPLNVADPGTYSKPGGNWSTNVSPLSAVVFLFSKVNSKVTTEPRCKMPVLVARLVATMSDVGSLLATPTDAVTADEILSDVSDAVLVPAGEPAATSY